MAEKPSNPRFKDLEGQVFARLTVIEYAGKDGNRRSHWKCRCECGEEIVTRGESLQSGHTRSCGCFHKDSVTTNGGQVGGKASPEYSVWSAMINRCCNEKDQAYHLYGGRGISVCDEWRNSLDTFIEDMGLRPSSKHSLDRIDTNGDYCKSNCRWATWKQQQRNRRNNKRLTVRGRTKLLVEWAEEMDIRPSTLRQRIYGYGWSEEKAVLTPVGGQSIG